jgi:hypothetical protein
LVAFRLICLRSRVSAVDLNQDLTVLSNRAGDMLDILTTEWLAQAVTKQLLGQFLQSLISLLSHPLILRELAKGQWPDSAVRVSETLDFGQLIGYFVSDLIFL